MFLELLRHLLFIRGNEPRTLDGIRTAEEFRAIINRERARTNRNGHVFSLVVFDPLDEDNVCTRRLAEVLSHRVRTTDEIGWFDERRIGVVLPYTPSDAARKVPDDVCQIIGPGAVSPSYSVYTYPSHRMPTGGSPDPRRESAGIPYSKEHDHFEKSFVADELHE